MRIVEASLERLRLEMVRPLRTASGTYAAREGFVVCLVDEEGRRGWGEAMPLTEFGTESPEDCERALRAWLPELKRSEDAALPERHPAARHALEQARLDLLSQRRGVPLCQWLSSEAREAVHVNALLGASAPEAVEEEARRAAAEGYETFKLKVAGRSLDEDTARLLAVRGAVGARGHVRIDANGGWTEPEASRALDAWAGQGLELCEQPVEAGAFEALGRLSARAPCPIAADESLALPGAAQRLLAGPRTVGVLVLKPMVLGGLLPALALAREAARQGLEAYVTSALDGVIARAGAAHLAAALPSGRYASGLGVGHLFRDEPDHPFRPVRGRIVLPRTPGQGVA
ncbi:o-succinylbenzoate synthase [Melittangium boletus]|uniref:o-succinylbenzoate synthase n=1 Tax=Melittangium boletus DSM 14713 TaxID=1294270 RepID=A0A250INP1_9BACT|nr:o-succinylbenzoate synthase [Melittangium boletus]ATB33369.1 o-succinylbenzoate synthase [Melittangium boletus DSM 14713]